MITHLLLVFFAFGGPVNSYKKPSAEELKKKLSPTQFAVTQHDETESPFANAYWNEKRDGIYVDVTTGEPLFSSLDKYDSGTGWPSFTKPIEKTSVVEKSDKKLWMERTEIRSKAGDAHLGHVFTDGPTDKGGLRYCTNSASLRFVPVEDLEKEGYGQYKALFEKGRKPNSEPKKTSDKQGAKMKTETATLAGGCFWGVEELIRQQPGVLKTEVGYTGGVIEKPTYEVVKTGISGHAEAIEVEYDPSKTSYEKLLLFFFKMHDPTTKDQQGNDIGTQYRSAIFYHNDEQKLIAEKVIARVDKSGAWKKPVVTEIVPYKKFFAAEGYHQDYLQKNPAGYTCHYVRKVEF